MTSVEPASLTWGGGAIEGTGLRSARLSWGGGSVGTWNESDVSGTAAIPKLDRLNRMLDKADGETEKQFKRRQLIWQRTMEAIEAAFVAVNAKVDDNSAVLARLLAVEQAAQVANDNAQEAKQTAQESKETVEAVNTATEETFGEVDPALIEKYRQKFPGYIDS